MDTATQVTLDADKEHVLPLYMPSKKDTGNSQKWEFPFFTCKTRTLFPSSLRHHSQQELETG